MRNDFREQPDVQLCAERKEQQNQEKIPQWLQAIGNKQRDGAGSQ
jgi:hypothetical protein